MILYTEEGMFQRGLQKDYPTIVDVCDIIEKAIDSGKKITIRELYRDYIDQDDCPVRWDCECFVDPDLWGWDQKGYRQLYKYEIKKIEL